MAQRRIVIAKRAVNRSSERDARRSLLARDLRSTNQSDGLVSVSGLLLRVAITSVLVAAMAIATNLLMLRWLA